ncbi:MAG TPA: Crp/Fnr family transcriptional regulator [Caulobacter sp.]|nr:Crp/Fnr family transcriptional regulator [Caulobacter sp.]
MISTDNWIDDLPAAVQRAISERMRTIRLARNEPLKAAGDAPAAIFQVEAGYLKLIRDLPDGRSQLILLYGPGGAFGETAVVVRRAVHDHATVALVPSRVRRLAVADFWDLYARHPEISDALCRKFARLVAMQLDRHDLTGALRLRDRIVVMLGALAQQLGARDANGAVTFTLPISHADIAHHVEATRQAVQREMSALAAAGLVRRAGHRWFLPKPDLLRWREA